MIGDRRRHSFDATMLIRVSIVWLVVAVLLTASQFRNIASVSFPDGDDILRLLQVRDFLAGQSWFDVTQYRVAPPEGTPMHWTRLVDIPLLMVIVPLTLLLGAAGAELAAAIIVPLATLYLMFLLIGRMAWKLFDEEVTGLACLVAAMSASLLNQLRPMRIDHHGWQIICALVAVNALMARNARQGGWIAGVAMAAWLSISLEAIPLVAAIMAVGLWRWIRCWHDRVWLVSMLQSTFVVSLGIYLATRGIPYGASVCDAMAPAPLAAMGVLAIGATGLGHGSHRPISFTLLALGTLGLAAVAVEFALAPRCTGGTFAGLDPVTRDMWLANVTEGQPIWDNSLEFILLRIIPPIIALIALFHLARNSSDWLRNWHREYAFLVAMALVTGCLVSRTMVYAAALSAVPLGWQLKSWLRSIRTLRAQPGRQVAATAGIVMALAPAVPLSVLMLAVPSQAASSIAAPAAARCEIRAALPALGMQPARIMAPLDLGPRILVDSDHSVLATAHHRANTAIADTMRAFTGPDSTAHEVVSRRGIDYVVFCVGINESNAYSTLAPNGFAAHLQAGKLPDWLEQVPGENGEVIVLRVKR